MLAATRLPRKVKVVPLSSIGTSRGTLGGSLIRANLGALAEPTVSADVLRGGATIRPRLRLRFDTYGNGCPGSTACGVRIGNTFSRKYSAAVLRSRLFKSS